MKTPTLKWLADEFAPKDRAAEWLLVDGISRGVVMPIGHQWFYVVNNGPLMQCNFEADAKEAVLKALQDDQPRRALQPAGPETERLLCVAKHARALLAAAKACDLEGEKPAQGRSSAPLVRYVSAMDCLRESLRVLDEFPALLGTAPAPRPDPKDMEELKYEIACRKAELSNRADLQMRAALTSRIASMARILAFLEGAT